MATTKPGVVQEFYKQVVLKHDGEGCLPWPYALKIPSRRYQSNSKYPTPWMRYDGPRKADGSRTHINVNVLRKVCEHFYGPPPQEGMEVCHDITCETQEGCVAYNHLRWGTREDNMRDRVLRREYLEAKKSTR
jgi:hypothetical protein